MKILLAGATGLIGTAFIDACSGSGIELELVLRKPSDHWPNLKQHIIDFDSIDSLTLETKFDALVCCLGTTIKKAGSQAAFRRVDYQYVVDLASWAEKHKVHHFSVISSIGANANSSNFYLRTKGEMENAVGTKDIPSISILRPSLLLGDRKEFRLGERIGQAVLGVLSPLLVGSLRKQKPVADWQVAKTLMSDLEQPIEGINIIESTEIFEA